MIKKQLLPAQWNVDQRAMYDLRRAQALCDVLDRVYNKERVLCSLSVRTIGRVIFSPGRLIACLGCRVEIKTV